ncbi:MAG: hypothetical protein D3916_00025 [Candidatus Electrothrix sp. MAN1_4]|nr:hypothetical protein [Candidatus Electrothrix sp. MAN1_4]
MPFDRQNLRLLTGKTYAFWKTKPMLFLIVTPSSSQQFYNQLLPSAFFERFFSKKVFVSLGMIDL